MSQVRDSGGKASHGQVSRFMAVFAGGTFLSRILGLVRDAVLAMYVPAPARDLFFLAFQLPNMLRDMLGEGAANAALIPTFTRRLEESGEAAYRRSIQAVLGVFVLLFAALTVAGILVAPYAPGAVEALRAWSGGAGHPDEHLDEMVALTQWMFPYLFFIGLTAFATAPLFIARHYFTPSWTPSLLNISLILCCVLPASWFGGTVWALVAGVWLGGIAQMGIMFWAMHRQTGVLLPRFEPRHADVVHVFMLLLPVVFGQTAGEINKLIDRFFAIGLETGTVTALYYSNRLIQLPLALFGIGMSVAILPSLSRALSRGETAEARGLLVHGFRQSFFLMTPCVLGLMFYGESIIRVLFQRGAFTAEDTAMTYTVMFYSAAGLLSFGWIKVAAQGFFALQDTRTPVAVAAGSMLFNIALNFAMVPGLGYRGLAMASTIAFTLNFGVLFALLNRRYGALFDLPAVLDGLKVLLISALAVGAGWGALAYAPLADNRWLEGGFLFIALAVSGGLYLALTLLARIPEATALTDAIRRRIR